MRTDEWNQIRKKILSVAALVWQSTIDVSEATRRLKQYEHMFVDKVEYVEGLLAMVAADAKGEHLMTPGEFVGEVLLEAHEVEADALCRK